MRIAVASTDGQDVSSHFGQSRCFVVFDIADGKIASSEVRDNTWTPHARGECDGADAHAGEHHHDHATPHSHADVVAALSDCDAVLCGGMGFRAAQELQAAGVRPLTVEPAGSAQATIEALLGGTLRGRGFCRCHE